MVSSPSNIARLRTFYYLVSVNTLSLSLRNFFFNDFFNFALLLMFRMQFCIFLSEGANPNEIENKNGLLSTERPCGLMDKAPDFGSGDCRFESCHGRLEKTFFLAHKITIVPQRINSNKMFNSSGS